MEDVRHLPPPPRLPYVGITGFTSPDQAPPLLDLLPAAAGRLLMVGVVASGRTLAGLPEEHPERHPAVESIPRLLPDHPLALNLIHFYTGEPAALGRQLAELARRAGPRLDGFQVNAPWPSPADLEEVRAARPGLRIVLQVGPRMLAGSSPGQVAARVREHQGLADDLLLDRSGGRGRPLDARRLRPYLEALATAGFGLGVAGGLGPEHLGELEPLVAELPALSFDAESRLRDARDRLDPARARQYLEAALGILGRG